MDDMNFFEDIIESECQSEIDLLDVHGQSTEDEKEQV
jgi:hypothetical protein